MDSSPGETLLDIAGDSRNWLELPRDVTLMILMKLSSKEILETAQFVCKLWYNLCKDPSMWRFIKMHNLDEPEVKEKYETMLYNAIDRTSSGLISLDIEGFGSDNLLSYIADRSSKLKYLRLACCYTISGDAVIKALKKLSRLEDLELTVCSFSQENAKDIIRACPVVKTFKLNELGSRNPSLACNDEALAISDNMHELRNLQLIGNSMTNEGLEAILSGCPHLESLDIRACFHVDLSGDIGKRCVQQMKNFRHPYDATDDYNFLTTDYDSDFDEIYADEYDDMDFLSDDMYYEFSDEEDDDDDDDDDDAVDFEY